MRILGGRRSRAWGMPAGWACLILLSAVSGGGQSNPGVAQSPAQQAQLDIASVQKSMAAMEGKYGQAGIAGTLDAAYKAKQTAAPQDAAAWDSWMAAAWNDVKPFYQSRLAALQAEQQAIAQKTATPAQLASLSSDASAWSAKEKQIEALFGQMTDKIAQQAVLLNLAKSNPAQQQTLTQQAAQLKTDAEHQRASAYALATAKPAGTSTASGNKKTTTTASNTGGTPKKSGNTKGGGTSASNKKKSGNSSASNKKKSGDSSSSDSGSGNGGSAEPTPIEKTVTVCKCKPSDEIPFNQQTTNESVQSTNSDIADATISDGRLVITGKKFGTAVINVKGEAVSYNVGIPDAPKHGSGGIHGNGPNSVPLNGNTQFAYKITVHVICDLTGSWSGAPIGHAQIVDSSCGSVSMSAGKAVFDGTAEMGANGYSSIQLSHTLTLDEVSTGLPDEVRSQVAGREVTIKGTVGADEMSIQATLTKDKVHWVKQDDGSYSVDFPGTITENVLLTRDGASGGGGH